jgi:hypothetical protein
MGLFNLALGVRDRYDRDSDLTDLDTRAGSWTRCWR